MKKLALALVILLAFVGCAKKDASSDKKVDLKSQIEQSSALDKIQKSGVLRVGMEAGYLPFEFQDETGKIIGFDADLAQKMADALKVKLELVNTAWDGIIPGLKVGKYDIIMSGMTRTLERGLSVNFTDPYYETGQVVMLRKGETRFKAAVDLNESSYTVAVKLGTTSDFASEKLLKKAKIEKYKTEADAAMALQTNKVDAFIYDKPYIEDYTEKFPDKVVMLPELFTKEYFGFAINKGDPDFQAWLNLFLTEIKADGSYEELYKKWFIDKDYKNKK